jgi:hypothetical protein
MNINYIKGFNFTKIFNELIRDASIKINLTF